LPGAAGRWALPWSSAGRLRRVPLLVSQALVLAGRVVRVKRQEEPRRALVPALVLLVRRRELLGSLPWVVLLQKTARTCPVRLGVR